MSELKPGNETSEFLLAKWFGVAGVTLQGVAGALAAALPANNVWVAVVIAIAGALIAVAAALGYQLPRAAVKSDALRMATIRDVAPQLTLAPPALPQPKAPGSSTSSTSGQS